MNKLDTNVTYHILSFIEPNEKYLHLLSKQDKTYEKYKETLDENNRNFTILVLEYICKPHFFMNILTDEDYEDYEDLKNCLRVIYNLHHSTMNMDRTSINMYNIHQYMNILKEISFHLMQKTNYVVTTNKKSIHTNKYKLNPRINALLLCE